MIKKETIKIRPDLKKLIPLLSTDERAGLEVDIVRAGKATVPLVLWGNVLLDGHNRYEICTEHGLPFSTVQVDATIEDLNDAKIWILRNQLNRRNLSPLDRIAVVKQLEERLAAKAKERQHDAGRRGAEGGRGRRKTLEENSPQGFGRAPQTRELAAEQAGVSDFTYRAGKVVLERGTPELQQAVREGIVAISTGAELAELPEETQRKVVAKGPKVAKAAAKAVKAARAEERSAEVKRRLSEAQAQAPTKAQIAQQEAVDFLETLPERGADLLLTDPPYMTDVDDIAEFVDSWLELAVSRVKLSGRILICTGAYPKELHCYLDRLMGLTQWTIGNVLVWTYRNTIGPTPKMDYKSNWQAIFYLRGIEAKRPLDCPVMMEQLTVQDISAPDGRHGNRWHSWQKPDELADRLVRHTTRPGDLVIDPFAGTGTFLLAAARLGRRTKGCEVSPETLQIALERGCETI